MLRTLIRRKFRRLRAAKWSRRGHEFTASLLAFYFIFCICACAVALNLEELVQQEKIIYELKNSSPDYDALRKMELDCELAFDDDDNKFLSSILAAELVYRACTEEETPLPKEELEYFSSRLSGSLFYETAREYIFSILSSAVCFPVDSDFDKTGTDLGYEDSWLFLRTYGGNRGHEGTDIMTAANKSGYYPVLSVSDGVVEKLGWLEQGGYRVGIRSDTGVYYYYAHLSSYADDLKKGDTVKAGDILGKMGDTGYGSEGTTGQFDVHLHFGIYVPDSELSDVSVNPYCILRMLEGEN